MRDLCEKCRRTSEGQLWTFYPARFDTKFVSVGGGTGYHSTYEILPARNVFICNGCKSKRLLVAFGLLGLLIGYGLVVVILAFAGVILDHGPDQVPSVTDAALVLTVVVCIPGVWLVSFGLGSSSLEVMTNLAWRLSKSKIRQQDPTIDIALTVKRYEELQRKNR